MSVTPRIIHVSIRLCLICCALAAVTLADQVQLKDGRVIEAEATWETGDLLWYRQGNLIASIAKDEIRRVVSAKESKVGATGESPKPATSTVTRIFLKGGTQIVADDVQEYGAYIRYRLGTLHTLIDRDAVERVAREVAGGEQPALPRRDLRFTTGHAGLDQLIADSASKQQLDPLLIYLVMREESRFNHRAVSPVGARGLMQLMPATARALGVRNIHDPVENVEAGTRYLKNLIELYQGDVNLALAAYNAGENAVARYGRRVPPFRETQNYVRRINAAYRKARAVTGDE
ncbi:MAG TPA: lytic transglycosylase domain-containing protein [Blastocatellia bacterium]|nr:lytic transglycosylase domain-containing protein [Blastocatellia bacterium]